MRWEDERQSENIDDRRDEGQGGGSGGGPFGGGFPMGRGGGGPGLPFPVPMGRMGIGGILVVLVLMFLFGGGDLGSILGGGGDFGSQPGQQTRPHTAPPQGQAANRPSPTQSVDRMRGFVAAVLGLTEDVWREQLPEQAQQHYREPVLVLFSGSTTTDCGVGQAAMGPFYCPADRKVYIDLSFFDDLARRYKAPGDFAQAYVIAHEVGHHIQNLLGISARMAQLRRQLSETEFNRMSVRVELQADCFAGVWAFHANRMRRVLEPGDLEEALAAATAIGDDRLQKQARGYAVPDSFTHGTSAQRVAWFRRGFDSGRMSNCDSFNARQL